ncbi:hypothetical protein [Enterococcus sp. AZ163]|uniref:hypothetical protein n=1 Tax=Enterococcus sp. AZ163 TaxID=2774638 RepID=UPI003D2841B7
MLKPTPSQTRSRQSSNKSMHSRKAKSYSQKEINDIIDQTKLVSVNHKYSIVVKGKKTTAFPNSCPR